MLVRSCVTACVLIVMPVDTENFSLTPINGIGKIRRGIKPLDKLNQSLIRGDTHARDLCDELQNINLFAMPNELCCIL